MAARPRLIPRAEYHQPRVLDHMTRVGARECASSPFRPRRQQRKCPLARRERRSPSLVSSRFRTRLQTCPRRWMMRR